MSSATVTRWSRALVGAGVCFFVAWQIAAVLGVDRSGTVVLGAYGFVFSVVFGKAYALVPSYFGRDLAIPRAPAVHLPLAVLGTVALFASAADFAAPIVGLIGRSSWLAGCLVFVGAIAWSVRDNLAGRETGTSEANADRRRVDRAANAVVPVAFAYLLLGASLPLLGEVGIAGSILPTGGAAVMHLLVVGAGVLIVFAIGFRLLPRFLRTSPRTTLVAFVLPTSALGPALLAIDFGGGTTFRIGALLQTVAVVGFAIAYADMYYRCDDRRVGFHAVLAGVIAGVAAVLLGSYFAVAGVDPALVDGHYRLAVGGFLGLTIVGVSYQFYPPAIGSRPGVGDRAALISIGLLVAGLAIETAGVLGGVSSLVDAGRVVGLLGAGWYAYVLLSLFVERL